MRLNLALTDEISLLLSEIVIYRIDTRIKIIMFVFWHETHTKNIQNLQMIYIICFQTSNQNYISILYSIHIKYSSNE
jgi:hypothetical protein